MPPTRPVRLGTRPTAVALVLAGVVALTGAVPATASSVVAKRDVVFAQSEEATLAVDLYRLRGARDRPVAVLVHGGSWVRGDKSDWARFAPEFVRAGFLVVVPNYRLAPPGGGAVFPAPSRDVALALEWTRTHASAYGGDPQRVAMVGTSAGAHLTIQHAAAEGSDRPEAVALFSPPMDLQRLHDKGVVPEAIESFLGCQPLECPRTYRHASPVWELDRRLPPVFLGYSNREVLPIWHGRTLDRRLDELGVRHRTMELKGTAHGLGVAARVLPEAVDFLRRRLIGL